MIYHFAALSLYFYPMYKAQFKMLLHETDLSQSVTNLSSVATLLNCLEAQELFVGSFMKLVSMAKQTSLRSPYAMPSVGWGCVKLAAIGLWSSEKAFSGVMTHISPSGSPTDKSVQENTFLHNA
jgi:hypothetical protein